MIRQLPKNPPKLARLPNAKKNFTLTRCSWDLPAPTLVVMGQQPNGLSGAIHPEEDRKFTLPELKRLFALPDDFILTGTVAQAAERTGRMQDALTFPYYDQKLKQFTARQILDKERSLRGQMTLWTEAEFRENLQLAGFRDLELVWASFPFIAILALK